MPHTDLLRKTSFELRHARPLNEHSGLEHVPNGSLLGLADRRSGEGDFGLHGWWSHWMMAGSECSVTRRKRTPSTRLRTDPVSRTPEAPSRSSAKARSPCQTPRG